MILVAFLGCLTLELSGQLLKLISLEARHYFIRMVTGARIRRTTLVDRARLRYDRVLRSAHSLAVL